MLEKVPSPDGPDLLSFVSLSLAVLVLRAKKPRPLKVRVVPKNLARAAAIRIRVWKRRLSFVTGAECVVWLRGASKRPSESSSTAPPVLLCRDPY